jgi:hypothetical protein
MALGDTETVYANGSKLSRQGLRKLRAGPVVIGSSATIYETRLAVLPATGCPNQPWLRYKTIAMPPTTIPAIPHERASFEALVAPTRLPVRYR